MKHFACLLFFIPTVAFAATIDVAVGPGLSFTPSDVTVAPGDIVRWVWAGAVHTSTSNTNSGPEVWDSGFLASGTFSHTFNTVGDWPYYCALHSFPGGTAMNGVVHVAAATTPTLSAINPVSGPTAGGTSVTLTGTNLSSACSVTFGGIAATGVSSPASTTITATTPAHAAGPVDVTVSCPTGSATLPASFAFVIPGAVDLLSGKALLMLIAALAVVGSFALRSA